MDFPWCVSLGVVLDLRRRLTSWWTAAGWRLRRVGVPRDGLEDLRVQWRSVRQPALPPSSGRRTARPRCGARVQRCSVRLHALCTGSEETIGWGAHSRLPRTSTPGTAVTGAPHRCGVEASGHAPAAPHAREIPARGCCGARGCRGFAPECRPDTALFARRAALAVELLVKAGGSTLSPSGEDQPTCILFLFATCGAALFPRLRSDSFWLPAG